MHPSDIHDNSTRTGAARTAARIHEYWKQRGYTVRTWTEELRPAPDATKVTSSLFTVRSDMLNGLPIGCKAQHAVGTVPFS